MYYTVPIAERRASETPRGTLPMVPSPIRRRSELDKEGHFQKSIIKEIPSTTSVRGALIDELPSRNAIQKSKLIHVLKKCF